MKWNILIPFSEKGNNLPLILLFIVQRSYGSGLFCSPVTIKGMRCEWSFLPNAVTYLIAVSAPPLRDGAPPVLLQVVGLLGRPGPVFWGAGACPTQANGVQTAERSRSTGGRMLRKAWAVLEPVINAQEASTLQGPH